MSDDAREHPEDSDAAAPQPDPVAQARVTPGQLLSEARESQQMSRDALAAQTMLAAETITALEDNALDQLPQPVFVRGYYRKCAKVLGIDENEMMQAYAAISGVAAAQPARPAQVDVIPQDVTPGNRRLFGIVLLVLLLIAAALVIWAVLPGLRGQLSLGTAGGGDEQGLQVESLSGPQTQSGADADESASEGKSATAPATDTDASAADAAPVTAATPSAQTKAAAGDGAAAASRLDEPAATAAAAQKQAQQQVQPAAEAAPALELRFTDRSWVQVRDASGARVLHGIIAAGQTREVSGKPPFKVALGYAPGVQVVVHGKTMPIAGKIKSDNTARFTVTASDTQ